MGVKLCTDCKHHATFDVCNAPQNFKAINLVNGKQAHRFMACVSHREDNWFWMRHFNTCGKKARWFEAKK